VSKKIDKSGGRSTISQLAWEMSWSGSCLR